MQQSQSPNLDNLDLAESNHLVSPSSELHNQQSPEAPPEGSRETHLVPPVQTQPTVPSICTSGEPSANPLASERREIPQAPLRSSKEFIAFCGSLDLYQQASKEGVRADEKRLYNPRHHRTFKDSLGNWVDNFKSTEDTLDKDKKKAKEVVDDDDLVSKVGFGFDADGALSMLDQSVAGKTLTGSKLVGNTSMTSRKVPFLAQLQSKLFSFLDEPIYSEMEKDIFKLAEKRNKNFEKMAKAQKKWKQRKPLSDPKLEYIEVRTT